MVVCARGAVGGAQSAVRRGAGRQGHDSTAARTRGGMRQRRAAAPVGAAGAGVSHGVSRRAVTPGRPATLRAQNRTMAIAHRLELDLFGRVG